MIMSKKNLLQDIKIKHPVSDTVDKKQIAKKEFFSNPSFPRIKSSNRNVIRRDIIKDQEKNRKPKYMLWLVAAISFLFFLFALSYLFLKVEITVNPKTIDITLNENLSASKNVDGIALPFDLIVISGEESKIIQTTGEENVSEQAKGVVIIYNAFSSNSQRLDVDTRLEGSNGKIYKTQKQIIVPGMKEGTPGSVEVNIYGSEAGEEYNSDPLDFTIVGFRGTAKYSKFYARSKGEIVGGFKGKASIISDTDKSSAVLDATNALQTKLFKKATDQIPAGFILFKGATFLDIDDGNINSFSSSTDNIVPITINGTLYGFLFNEEKLTKKIIENNTVQLGEGEIFISNIRDLTFSLINKDSLSFGNATNINFSLSGLVKFVWRLDENKLITDLLGKSKKDFNQILLQYPSINAADLVISPFWKISFPDKTKDIKVIVHYPSST